MIEFLKWFSGIFTGKTPEYKQMVESFDSMQNILSKIRKEADEEREQHREQIRIWIKRESEWRRQESQYHVTILNLQTDVAQLKIEVTKLKSK